MSVLDRLLGALPWLVATLFAAAAVHIVSILAMPHLAPEDAFSRLRAIAPRDDSVVLLRGADAAALPFADPAMAQAICFYDVDDKPLRVRADVAAGGFTGLSLRSRDGRVFYAMTDRGALDGKFDAVVLTQPVLDRIEAGESDDAPQELRVVSPTATGFIVLETLVAHPSERAEKEALLATMTCKNENR